MAESGEEQMKIFVGLLMLSSAALAAPPEMSLVNPHSNLIVVDERLLPVLPEAQSIKKLEDGTIRLHRLEQEVPYIKEKT